MAMPVVVEGRVQLQRTGGTRLLLPVGFRFRPTDEELLLHYLRRKALSCPLIPVDDIIPVVADLATIPPWELPPGIHNGDGERYFFHLPVTRWWRRKGRSAAGVGMWRASGKEKLVVTPGFKQPVGTKRTLVFFHPGGKRSDWAMHEYRLLPAGAEAWVVCRVFKKTTSPARTGRRRHMPAASCVTESGKNGGDNNEEEEITSNWP